ncbi:hypothetical protein MSIM_22830 [Mycobacterium simiae]|nr:hypothetical protein MSIM_22830 [Mycobacterium simiae]
MRARTRPGRPVGADGDETRRRITAATMKCVPEVGYARATIREIARAAGTSRHLRLGTRVCSVAWNADACGWDAALAHDGHTSSGRFWSAPWPTQGSVPL